MDQGKRPGGKLTARKGAAVDQCLECGECSRNCGLLAEVGMSPKRLAEGGVTASTAFSCTLCGGCEAACPAGVSPRELFAAGRRSAVAAGELDIEAYRYLLPDRPNSLMSVFREYSGIDYRDIEASGSAACCFFPGCTLLTYAPQLTRRVFDRLKDDCGCSGLLTDCCGKPLSQLGLTARADRTAGRLLERIRAHNVRELIVACPGCYYDLRSPLAAAGVRLRTVYEALALPAAQQNGKVCTVHDSCPDRFEGIFGRQVRQLLAAGGFSLAEMSHSGLNTMCCGSGGMISHFRPDLTQALVEARLAEARAAGADSLVSYCMSCVLKFVAKAGELPTGHVLGLLLGQPDDLADAKGKVARMLEGPEGAEIWAKIMAD